MSTVAYRSEGILVGGSRMVGSAIGALMALAGSALPVIAEPERIYPPKVYPVHRRHQGTRECARRRGSKKEGRNG